MSGNEFIQQISIVYALLRSTNLVKPSVVMGSSGGTITSLLLLASLFNPETFVELSTQFQSSQFIKRSAPLYSKTMSLLTLGSVYKCDVNNIITMLTWMFGSSDPRIFNSVEFIIGTYSSEFTVPVNFSTSLRNSNESIHSLRSTDGLFDVDTFARAVIASFSIPCIFDAVRINLPVVRTFSRENSPRTGLFVDGGIGSPSPITQLCLQHKGDKFVYVGSSCKNITEPNIFMNTVRQIIAGMSNSELNHIAAVCNFQVIGENVGDWRLIQTEYNKLVACARSAALFIFTLNTDVQINAFEFKHVDISAAFTGRFQYKVIYMESPSSPP